MPFVATLISAPAEPALADALLGRAAGAVPSAGAPVWLADGSPPIFPSPRGAGLDCRTDGRRQSARRSDGAPVDVVVQPLAHARKRLFLADMDFDHDRARNASTNWPITSGSSRMSPPSPNGQCAARSPSSRRCASASRCSRGSPPPVVDEVIAERITLTPGGPDAGRHHARARRPHLPGLRRLHAVLAAHRAR